MTTTLTNVEEMFTGPITGEQGRTFVKELIATAPTPISLEVLNTPGTPESAIMWAAGEAEAQRSADRLQFAKSAFRSTASRNWLAIVADQCFGVVAKSASFATTNVATANTGGGSYGPFAPGTLRYRNSVTQAIYVNQEEVSIAAGPSNIDVGVIAIEPGSASNAQPSEIDELETPLEGVAVVNLQAAIGQDQESAAAINDRIDARLGSFGVEGATGFSTGASTSAFESIAKNGPDNGGGVLREDGSRITVTRTKLVKNVVANTITIYLADDDGPLAGGDLTLVSEALLAYAEWIGSTVIVLNASTVIISVSGALTIRGTSTDAALFAAIDTELANASRIAPIGGFPPDDGISVRYVENAVESAGDAGKTTAFILVDIELSSPAAFEPLAEDEVAVISRSTITITRV